MAIIKCYAKTISWHMCDPILEPKFTSPIYRAVGYKPDQTGVSNVGTPVKNGDLIGYADNTGASTGDHLHYGLKSVALNESNGAFYNLNQDNGYMGAIDPAPYFNGLIPGELEVISSALTTTKNIADSIATSDISATDKQSLYGSLSGILSSLKNMFK